MSKRRMSLNISLSNAAFMTYCLGIINCSGLVMAMTPVPMRGRLYFYLPKLFDFSQPGERVIILSTSGSLSLTQVF